MYLASLHVFIGVFKKCLQWRKLRKDFEEKFCGLPAMRVRWRNLYNSVLWINTTRLPLCVNSYPVYWNKLQGLSLFRQIQNADKYVPYCQLWIYLALAGLKNLTGLSCVFSLKFNKRIKSVGLCFIFIFSSWVDERPLLSYSFLQNSRGAKGISVIHYTCVSPLD